jgi:hypothetical protein
VLASRRSLVIPSRGQHGAESRPSRRSRRRRRRSLGAPPAASELDGGNVRGRAGGFDRGRF